MSDRLRVNRNVSGQQVEAIAVHINSVGVVDLEDGSGKVLLISKCPHCADEHRLALTIANAEFVSQAIAKALRVHRAEQN